MPDRHGIAERLNYWHARVMKAKEAGAIELVVTPEEFHALRRLGDDVAREDLLVGREVILNPVVYGFPVRVE